MQSLLGCHQTLRMTFCLTEWQWSKTTILCVCFIYPNIIKIIGPKNEIIYLIGDCSLIQKFWYRFCNTVTTPSISSRFTIQNRGWLQVWKRQKVLHDKRNLLKDYTWATAFINFFFHFYWLWDYIVVFWHIKEYLGKYMVPECLYHRNFH